MSKVSIFSALVLVTFAAGVCQADSLVITYRSGKTQTVVLDEPSQSINSWQFVAGTLPQQQSLKQNQVPPPITLEPVQKQTQADLKAPEKIQKKSGIRVNWNAKPIPD